MTLINEPYSTYPSTLDVTHVYRWSTGFKSTTERPLGDATASHLSSVNRNNNDNADGNNNNNDDDNNIDNNYDANNNNNNPSSSANDRHRQETYVFERSTSSAAALRPLVDVDALLDLASAYLRCRVVDGLFGGQATSKQSRTFDAVVVVGGASSLSTLLLAVVAAACYRWSADER